MNADQTGQEGPLHGDGLRKSPEDLAALVVQNQRLAQTLKDARDEILKLKEEVDRLAQPPAGFGTFLARNDDDSIDVFTGGRKLRVNVSPSVDLDALQRGQEVMLNEALNVVAALEFEQIGEVVMLKEILADRERVLVFAHSDEERVVRLARSLDVNDIKAGDSLLLDSRSGYVYEKVPKYWRLKKYLTSTTPRSVAWSDRSSRSVTRSSCRISTLRSSRITSSSRRRVSCSTVLRAVARH